MLAAMHTAPGGFAPNAARRVQAAYTQIVMAEPGNTQAQLGLLQIIRERAVHKRALLPWQKAHKQKLRLLALTQLGAVLALPQTPELRDMLLYADDVWGVAPTPQSEAAIRSAILPPLAMLLCAAETPAALRNAILKAFERLSLLQPWCLPHLVAHIEAFVSSALCAPEQSVLLPATIERALAAPLGLSAHIVALATPLRCAHPGDAAVLSAVCRMLKAVLLPPTASAPAGQQAISELGHCIMALPGEPASYESVRVLLAVAESYDHERTEAGARLAIQALQALQPLVATADERQSVQVVRSMLERALAQLEQTAQTDVAQQASVQLAQMHKGKQVKARRLA